VALATFSGCGYHFAASGPGLPASARTIYVDKFANLTRITGLNDQFNIAMKDEIANRRRLVLVKDRSQADLELSGSVVLAQMMPAVFNAVTEAMAYTESVSVAASLRDLKTGKVLWSSPNISSVQYMPFVAQAVIPTSPSFLQQTLRGTQIGELPDIQVAQTQVTYVRQQLMSKIASTVYDMMSDRF
jgi:hypothetical protein